MMGRLPTPAFRFGLGMDLRRPGLRGKNQYFNRLIEEILPVLAISQSPV